MIRLSLLWLVVLATGCGGGQLPEVVDARHVAAGHGAPRISRVIDLGGVTVPLEGQLRAAHTDGKAVIGELLLVEGNNLGKQPTVTMGGRPTEVLAHAAGGGVVVRVPWGIDPGAVELEVQTAGGRHVASVPIRRVGLVVTGRSVVPFEVGADGALTAAGKEMPLPGARHVALSSDGVAAYVAGESGGPVLWILDLSAPEPVVVGEHRLPGSRVIDLATAEQAPLGVVATDTHLVYFQTGDPLRPPLYPPQPIPASLSKKTVLAAALGGQGRIMALLLADLNQVAVVDISAVASPGPPTVVDVLPGSRLPVVQDLRFSADEASLWVVSGDTVRSIEGGLQTARVTLLQVAHGTDGERTRAVKIHQTWDLGDGEAPMQVAVARGNPIPPGTVIRPEPSTSAVYVATLPSNHLRGAAKTETGGGVVRSGLGKTPERLMAGPWFVTSLDVVGKTQVLLGLGARSENGRLEEVLLGLRAWEKGGPRILRLGYPPRSGATRGREPWLGEVRAQP